MKYFAILNMFNKTYRKIIYPLKENKILVTMFVRAAESEDKDQ